LSFDQPPFQHAHTEKEDLFETIARFIAEAFVAKDLFETIIRFVTEAFVAEEGRVLIFRIRSPESPSTDDNVRPNA